MYTRLDNCETEDDLTAMKKEISDRFGPIPREVEDLFVTVRCRKLAVDLGFEKMSLKQDMLRCYFINRVDSPYFESEIFSKILNYLQTQTNKAQLKQTGRMFMLIAGPFKGMEEMHSFLASLHLFCFAKANILL